MANRARAQNAPLLFLCHLGVDDRSLEEAARDGETGVSKRLDLRLWRQRELIQGQSLVNVVQSQGHTSTVGIDDIVQVRLSSRQRGRDKCVV
jgi:hypothetical protein